jgi:two-component sensor histidine kinase
MPRVHAQPDPQLLAWEANHRFLNTLAALDGLLHDDFGGFSDPSVREAVTAFSGHLRAFANVHQTLGPESDEPEAPPIDAAAYMARLCRDLCAAHLAPRGVRCQVRVERAVMPRDACLNLGLIVIELVTNAARHAFAGRADGQVWVTLGRGERGWICQVADNGSGLRDVSGDGGGLKLARGLAATLRAALDIRSDPGGVTATVRLPGLR